MKSNPRVVILGGGFAGATCAQSLEKKQKNFEMEVVLIDRNNYFIFYPLLVEAGTGSLEPRHAVVSIRAFLKKTQFLMAEITGVNLQNQKITCQMMGLNETKIIPYDHLILGLGSVTHLPLVEGLSTFGFEMKSLQDAVELRDRAIQMLELANATSDLRKRRALLHFVVVGGNFTGVEVAGEFRQFLGKACRLYPRLNADDIRLTLVEITPRILQALDNDTAQYALHQLRQQGVSILLNTSIDKISADHCTLQNGQTLFTHTVIWCAGIAPNPLIKRFELPVDKKGYILCDEDLRVKGFENVWAIGDCALTRDEDGKPYPAMAQIAAMQGKHLAKNLVKDFQGQPTVPCHLHSKGNLTALGLRRGVGKIYGKRVEGFSAWFLWRTFYLLKMPGLLRKMRIAVDWTLDLIFSKDYVQLGVHKKGGP